MRQIIEQIRVCRKHSSAGLATRASLSAELLRIGLRWFVKRRIGPGTDIAEVRRWIELIQRYVPAPSSRTETLSIKPAGVSAHWITTAASDKDRHVLYLHGGAYIAGSPLLYRDVTWRIAKRARARVLCIDYRLAPEFPFPAAIDDVIKVYRWLVDNGANPRRIAIMGDSAGGGLAFATLLKLRDDGASLPAAAVALSPWTDLAFTGMSMKLNAETEALMNSEEAPRFADYYLAGADPRTPYASPLYGDLSGLPPTLIQVGSDEMLLDDSLRMADKLRVAKCEVDLEIWPRMPHAWHFFARLLPEARRAIERIGIFLRAHT